MWQSARTVWRVWQSARVWREWQRRLVAWARTGARARCTYAVGVGMPYRGVMCIGLHDVGRGVALTMGEDEEGDEDV